MLKSIEKYKIVIQLSEETLICEKYTENTRNTHIQKLLRDLTWTESIILYFCYQTSTFVLCKQ